MVVEIEGVPLHLAHPDELSVTWVGQEEVMRQLLAAWLVIDAQDRLIACEGALFERPGVRVTGKPRVTRTDLKTGKMEVLAETYEGKRVQKFVPVAAR